MIGGFPVANLLLSSILFEISIVRFHLHLDTMSIIPLTAVKSPPNCGVVSSTTSLVNDIVSISGLVPSSAVAYAITVLLFATVTLSPVPDTYLNTTF